MQPSVLTTRRRRPHPARRARRIASATSVAGVFVLTGCMAATAKTSSPAASSRANAATPTTHASSASANTAPDTSSGSGTIAARACVASAQAHTSTHAS
jgi:hypothetical protein